MKQSNCIISKEALTEEQESEEIHRIHSVVKEKSSLIRCPDGGGKRGCNRFIGLMSSGTIHQVSADEAYGDLPLDRPDLFFTWIDLTCSSQKKLFVQVECGRSRITQRKKSLRLACYSPASEVQ